MNRSDCAAVLVHTASHAIKLEKILHNAGIVSKLVPVPRHLGSDCGVCVRIRNEDEQRVLKIVNEVHMEIAGIYPL